MGGSLWFLIVEALKKQENPLRNDERIVCIMHYMLEMSISDIANLLGENPDTLKSRIRRRIKPAIEHVVRELGIGAHLAITENSSTIQQMPCVGKESG